MGVKTKVECDSCGEVYERDLNAMNSMPRYCKCGVDLPEQELKKCEEWVVRQNKERRAGKEIPARA